MLKKYKAHTRKFPVKIVVFWHVMKCSLVCKYVPIFEMTSALKVEAVHYTKALVPIYQAT
jgi:hypothetical protein